MRAAGRREARAGQARSAAPLPLPSSPRSPCLQPHRDCSSEMTSCRLVPRPRKGSYEQNPGRGREGEGGCTEVAGRGRRCWWAEGQGRACMCHTTATLPPPPPPAPTRVDDHQLGERQHRGAAQAAVSVEQRGVVAHCGGGGEGSVEEGVGTAQALLGSSCRVCAPRPPSVSAHPRKRRARAGPAASVPPAPAAGVAVREGPVGEPPPVSEPLTAATTAQPPMLHPASAGAPAPLPPPSWHPAQRRPPRCPRPAGC